MPPIVARAAVVGNVPPNRNPQFRAQVQAYCQNWSYEVRAEQIFATRDKDQASVPPLTSCVANGQRVLLSGNASED
jgi:hypothetical protein